MLPKFSMKLEWKEFNVSLDSMETWLRANAGSDYCGNSADSSGLTLWFMEEPAQEVKDAINAKWDALDANSAEAQAYESAADKAAAAEAKKASARAKLAALGLSVEEVAALFG